MNESLTHPQVCLVPLKKVLLHERVDPRRVAKLKAGLLRDGALKDPPIAVRHNGRFIILDGATRTQALKELNVLQLPLQVVRYHEPTVRLDTWNHIMLEIPAHVVRSRVQTAARSQGHLIDPQVLRHELAVGHRAFGFFSEDGPAIAFNRIEDHCHHIAQLNRVVEACRELTNIYRSHESELSILKASYPHLSAVLAYPRFRPPDVIQCVLDKVQMPAGITRHLIDGRVLGLNFPLELLMDSNSLEQEHYRLKDRIRAGLFTKICAENGETLLRFDLIPGSYEKRHYPTFKRVDEIDVR